MEDVSKSPMSGFEIGEAVSEFGVALKDISQFADASDYIARRTSGTMPSHERRVSGRRVEIMCNRCSRH
jgi:hypothetical protein